MERSVQGKEKSQGETRTPQPAPQRGLKTEGESGQAAGMPLFLTFGHSGWTGRSDSTTTFQLQPQREDKGEQARFLEQENLDSEVQPQQGGAGGRKSVFNENRPAPAPARPTIQRERQNSDEGPSEEERSTLDEIREILGYTWVGPFDEADLEQKWGSFGDRLPDVANRNFGLWTQSIQRGAELEDLPAVTTLKRRFASDVRRKALGYIRTNRALVESELSSLGVEPSGEMGGAGSRATPRVAGEEEAQARTRELTEIAELIQRAQTAQRLLSEIEVGYELEPQARPGLVSILVGQGDPQEHARDLVARSGRRHLMPTGFSPLRRPAHPPFGDEEPPMTSYEEVKSHYDDLTAVIEGYSTRYPSIYAVIQGHDVNELARAGNPAQARRIIVRDLREALGNMQHAAQMISSGDLDYHDLGPIVAQLSSGESAASGTDWSEQLPRWVLEEDMRGHRATEFWITLGLGSLAAAAFLFLEIASLGTATFFIAATVALGASGALAARSWERYDDLATAAGAEVSAETELVRSGAASRALVGAIVDTAFFFLTAKGVWSGARAARMASGGSRLPSPPAAGSVAMEMARSLVVRRIEVLKSRIAAILSRRGPRGSIVDTARRELDQVREVAVTHAANIRQGTGAISSELQGLSQAQRNALAAEMIREVGQEYRNALRVLERAELMVPRVVSPPGAGYGARPLGPPPVRRPPSTRGGEGWENW